MKAFRMSSKKISFAFLLCAAALAACSSSKNTGGDNNNLNSDGGNKTGSGGKSGSDAGGTADCMHIDYSSYGKGASVSLKDDLLPMFGLSCVTSDCHGSGSGNMRAGLFLGNKCAYDVNAKWKCTFPTTAPSDPTQPAPDDDMTVMSIYTSLLADATTVTSPTVKRVAPGDPANSFLVLKLADQENSKGYTCMNQDPSHEDSPPPCGVSMPQNGDLFCQGTDRAKFDAIAEWVAQGAMNN
jgi:hypothetical protein